ncbi:MAG: hypothetical protein V7739_04585 [Motiliproteus sp.]
MELIAAVVSVILVAGILPFYKRDPWKGALWLILLALLCLQALSTASDSLILPWWALGETLAAALLGVVTFEAACGRRQAGRAFLVLVPLGLLCRFISVEISGYSLSLLMPLGLLSMASIIFVRLELQHKPGAGWVLLGVIAWLIRLWLLNRVLVADSYAQILFGLSLITLVTFMLAVRKQLRLSQ